MACAVFAGIGVPTSCDGLTWDMYVRWTVYNKEEIDIIKNNEKKLMNGGTR